MKRLLMARKGRSLLGPLAITSAAMLLMASAGQAQIVAHSIGDGVTRVHANEDARREALPSFALQQPIADGPGVSVSDRVKPVFSEVEGKHRAVIAIEAGTSLYGTGECAGPLLRNGRITECWNTDAYGYGDDAKRLYKSHPWVLAVRSDGSAFGVLADTTYRCEIDLTKSIQFTADGPAFGVIVIDPANGKGTPQDVLKGLAQLVGTMAMPPKWAIGYHQCRYSYYPELRVREIATEFRKRSIPCDVIWHDIDYMHGFRCFTWDKSHFQDPAAHNAWLHERGFKTVWMIDPGIKAEPGYFVYDQMIAGNHGVQRADGTTYQGEVWPGMCVFPDFTRAETRQWWAGLYKDFMATGVDGVWNDMNEPAVFNVKSKTMPEDNLHRADASLGGPGPHAQYHNTYGTLMVQATHEGIVAANPEKRPFVLSRALFMGGHRYGASWTGDNTANWYHVETSIPMTLNLGLSGQPFAGPDIGGFAGNGDGEMFARWMGFGALLPFSRGHTGKENIDKEPWAFGEKVEATSREALNRRYRLLPYFYTLFHEASVSGLPVMRPVFFADPTDPALRSEDDAFLIGDDLLVVPQVVPDRTRVPVLPKGDWREIDLFKSSDPDQPRLYQRGGSIIPIGPVMQYVGERDLTLTLLVAPGADGQAAGVMYDDAGEGLEYQRGQFRLSTFKAEHRGDVVVIGEAVSGGELAPTWKAVDAVLVMLPSTNATRVEVDVPVHGGGASATPAGAAREGAPAFDVQLAKSGAALHSQLGCVACHSVDERNVGPARRGMFGSERKLKDGRTVIADEAYIRRSILEPGTDIVATFPNQMVTYKGRITDDQIEALTEYLKSLSAK